MRYEATAVCDRVAALKQAWYLNAVPESPVRRFPLGFLTGSAGALIVLACRASWSPFASFRTDAPLCEQSGCEEWREGLQGWLHCLSRERGERCSHGEYGVHSAGYVSGLYGLRRDDA